MIHKVTMYSATCDNCNKKWSDEHYGWTALSDELSMENILNEEGWHMGDEENNEGVNFECYCPDCWSYDDNDNFVLSKKQKQLKTNQ